MDKEKKSLEDKKHSNVLPAGESRRRFVKGTLIAAPVLMTVVSRPAWGNVCSPSGMVSGNISTPGGDQVDCATGLAPNDYVEYNSTEGEWQLNSNWPSLDSNLSFNSIDVFQTGPAKKLKQVLQNAVSGTTLGDVVWESSVFERAAVAALANAVSGRTDYLTPYTVRCMVHDVLTGAGYVVSPGCIWYQADVLEYFMFTWGEV